MENVLGYAPPHRPQRRRALFGGLTMTVSLFGGILAAYLSWSAAEAMISTFSGCATGRGSAGFQMMFHPPLACVIPAVGWYAAKYAAVPTLLCRCALWCGLSAWFASWLCMYL
jgi:hypothetical protein